MPIEVKFERVTEEDDPRAAEPPSRLLATCPRGHPVPEEARF